MDVVELASSLIRIRSESRNSNREVSDFISRLLTNVGFEMEELTYVDANGEEKVSLVAKKGNGTGGLAFLSHSDTVPGGEGWDPFDPRVEDGRLIGRGSCDMKGPLAAAMLAASSVDAGDLKHPVYVMVAADEEVGLKGAQHIVLESRIMKKSKPQVGVITEATGLIPVYAHKGVVNIGVTAHGTAAHSSSDHGDSSVLKMAPFLSDMAELAQECRNEERFLNREFNPPHNGFNMIVEDDNKTHNVTSAKTTCKICIRSMPDAAVDEVVELIRAGAEKHGLEYQPGNRFDPFQCSTESELIKAACRATGVERAVTVPYGTEAFIYGDHLEAAVLGPGSMEQAHTRGEWIDVAQMERSVDIYRNLLNTFCL